MAMEAPAAIEGSMACAASPSMIIFLLFEDHFWSWGMSWTGHLEVRFTSLRISISLFQTWSVDARRELAQRLTLDPNPHNTIA